jgi:hypothetical protein
MSLCLVPYFGNSTGFILKHDEHVTKQMITLLHTIRQQNYFAFQNNIFQPNKGIAVGSPMSGIIAEIFLQFLNNKGAIPTHYCN